MKASELRDLSNDELTQRLEDRLGALRNFRFNMITGTVDNVRMARTARRDVARIRTVLREREIQAAQKAAAAKEAE